MTNQQNLKDMLTALEGVQENPYAPNFKVDINEAGQIIITVEEDKTEEPVEEPAQEVKFMYNGIKVNGELTKAYIWIQNDEPNQWQTTAKGTLTFTAKNYSRFPKIAGLVAHNETDGMTDYFDNDRIYIEPTNPHYEAALKAYNRKDEIEKNALAKREAKRAEKRKAQGAGNAKF